MHFKGLYLFIILLVTACSSNKKEENIQLIYPKGIINLSIETQQKYPKQFFIENIYTAFAEKTKNSTYKIYIKGQTLNYDLWIQGFIPIDSNASLDMKTGIGIFGANKSSKEIELTYQAFNAKLNRLNLPDSLGELLQISFEGEFYEKPIEDNLLNIETAEKKLIICKLIQLQLVEDIIEAKKQIE